MTTKTTTQQQHPARATWRTVVQGILSTVLVLGVALPVVAGILDEEIGYLLGEHAVAVIVSISAGVAAVAGALARIMAVPAVDAWLKRLGLASGPGA
jgi:hypothetical protein